MSEIMTAGLDLTKNGKEKSGATVVKRDQMNQPTTIGMSRRSVTI